MLSYIFATLSIALGIVLGCVSTYLLISDRALMAKLYFKVKNVLAAVKKKDDGC
jgi:hypothetical protein